MPSGVACGGSVAALSLTQKRRVSTANTTSGRSNLWDDRSIPAPSGALQPRALVDQKIQANAEKIIRAFNTWAFKREQPSDPQLMLQTVANACAAAEPIHFVLYWGKGPRHRACAHEAHCLDFLGGLASRIAAVYAPGAALTLILTDTHAGLNGHCREDIERYFDDIKAAAAERGFGTCWLGDLVRAADAATTAPTEEPVPGEMLTSLVASARKWYHGPATAQEGALAYLRMNLIERRVVESAFPGKIFITFNGSELRGLFPRKLPIFYMYSLRRGVSVKPWFLPAEPAQPDANAGQENSLHSGTA